MGWNSSIISRSDNRKDNRPTRSLPRFVGDANILQRERKRFRLFPD
jgi:hypothetical protein